MPKAARIRAVDEPNLVLPFATSYNERGAAGYTHTVTNSEDQRKINCFYELTRNPVTGKGTLTLSKRPGVTNGGSGYGTTTQNNYLILSEPNNSGTAMFAANVPPWIIYHTGTQIKASSLATDTLILGGAGNNIPAFITRTNISSTETVVLQIMSTLNVIGAHGVYFSSAIATWTQISDADFTVLGHRGQAEHLDGFMFILDGATNRIYNSDTNSLANWTSTSFIAKQITQDPGVGLMKFKNQILAFGDSTVEVFYNAGNTVGSPLGRIPQLSQRIGLIPAYVGASLSSLTYAGHYYCTIGQRVFFVGRGAGGIHSASVYTYDGNSFEKVSTPYIDKILSEAVNSSFYSVNSIGVNGQQAASFLLTDPNATTQRWLMFFPEWKEWFEWTSTTFSPINSGEFFLSCLANSKDVIYKLTSTDNWQDDGTSYPWSTQFRLPTNGSSLTYLGMYGIDADTDSSGTANTVTVEISTDDCVSFSTLGTLDQAQDRKVNIGGGSFRKAHIRMGNTNSRPSRWHNFLGGID